jgi:hypothetical protein
MSIDEILEQTAIQVVHRVVDAACWGFTAYLFEGSPELIPELKRHFPDSKFTIQRPSLLLIDWTPRGKSRAIGVLKTDLKVSTP